MFWEGMAMTNIEHLKKFIYANQKVAGLTNKAFSEQMGVSERLVNKWRKNPSIIDADKLGQLFDVLGATDDDILAVFGK
jgi:transcriptional regulator with XRE-family HTH domain